MSVLAICYSCFSWVSQLFLLSGLLIAEASVEYYKFQDFSLFNSDSFSDFFFQSASLPT